METYRATLQIKVCNAAKRDDDAYYLKEVELVLPPLPGTVIVVHDTKINTKIKPKEFTVRSYKQHTADQSAGRILIVLDQDNTTFKQPGEFGRICKRLEELGFHLEPSAVPKRRKAAPTTAES